MSITAFPRPRRTNSLQGAAPGRAAARAAREPVAPPSGALINAILSYADIEEEAGAGHVILRVSARRAKDKVIGQLLGREAARLADVSIIWNEDEAQIFRVLDAATPLWADTDADPALEPQFELTEEALAYIAATTGEDAQARRA
jgi:hypothetical protein